MLSILLPLLLAAGSRAAQDPSLFPFSSPIEEGRLEVSGRHKLWYARFGNPQGHPVIVLHGGPGFGCYPRLVQYFDPARYHVVLHDQRGAGKSWPHGRLRENTTAQLVADIETLREHLGIEGKALVFGGSWGSTLGLAYAEAHPGHVSGLILRGVFTGRRSETDNVWRGGAGALFFPGAWASLQSSLPDGQTALDPARALEVFRSRDRTAALHLAEAWGRYSRQIGRLHTSPEELGAGFGDWDPIPASRIDAHFAANGYFLEEGALLRDAGRLEGIPTTIINGRYDLICPPVTAWDLHQRIPGSRLVIVEEAGHSESEPGITRAVLEAVATFEPRDS